MVAYRCKHCGKFTILGYVNEFKEHFCCIECYKKYCERHGYDFDGGNKLKKVRSAIEP